MVRYMDSSLNWSKEKENKLSKRGRGFYYLERVI